jgi:hypothetical protein
MLSIASLCVYARKGLQQTLNEFVLLPPLNQQIADYAFDNRDMYFLEQSTGNDNDCDDCSWECLFQEQREREWNVEELTKILLGLDCPPFDELDWNYEFWSSIFSKVKDKTLCPQYCKFEQVWAAATLSGDWSTPDFFDFISPKEVAQIYSSKNLNDFVRDLNFHLHKEVRITKDHPFQS